jgi:hypothetical protein
MNSASYSREENFLSILTLHTPRSLRLFLFIFCVVAMMTGSFQTNPCSCCTYSRTLLYVGNDVNQKCRTQKKNPSSTRGPLHVDRRWFLHGTYCCRGAARPSIARPRSYYFLGLVNYLSHTKIYTGFVDS